MRTLLLASAAVLVSVTAAASQPQEALWDHNGSLMRTVDDGYRIVVTYERVRPSLRQTTPQGALAFEGVRVNGNSIVGNAFVHTKYCFGKPFPYRVTGSINGMTVDVWGPAAVVDPYSCRIVGYEPNSDNARRFFQIPPPPPIVVVPQPVPVPVPVLTGPNSDNTKGHTVICPVVGDCFPNGKSAPPPPHEMSPDEQAEELERKAQVFCLKYPGHMKCNGNAERSAQPPPAVPLEK